MPEINCENCEKVTCEHRVSGALCVLNKDLSDLMVICETRDPKLMASKLAILMGSEMNRYQKAIKVENIGEDVEMTFINKKGQETVLRKKGTVDSKVTQLAHSIMKSGKMINEILNPPKVIGFQQNNQYNFGPKSVLAIEALQGEERIEAIKFLDERINGAKQ